MKNTSIMPLARSKRKKAALVTRTTIDGFNSDTRAMAIILIQG